MKSKSKYACGVDIGGSHVTAALIEIASNSIVKGSVNRSRIDASKSADEIVRDWTLIIKQALSAVDEKKSVNVGIAMPGPFDYEAGISYIKGQHKYEAFYNVNVKTLLAEALKQPAHTITFANDAACFLQGEVAGGIAKGLENVLGFTLGTGLGSAWFNNGIAEDADLWHSPFINGIAEDYLSTRWFVNRYSELAGKPIADVKEIAEIYLFDEHARIAFDEFGISLGTFIRKTIGNDDIDMVVLGGNIAQALPLFKNGMDLILSDITPAPVIQQSVLGEHAALLGAVSINTLITAL
jgi:glucokinase